MIVGQELKSIADFLTRPRSKGITTARLPISDNVFVFTELYIRCLSIGFAPKRRKIAERDWRPRGWGG